MCPNPLPELPPGSEARYTRGEVMLTCLCWFTPGTAAALFFAAYMKWFWELNRPNPIWQEVVLWSAVAVIFIGCAGFAGAIHAAKSGQERLVRRTIAPAFVFLLGQVIVAPLMAALMFFLVWS